MSNDVFPSNLRGLGFNVTKTPAFSTIVQASSSFVENRILQAQNPQWKWTLLYDVLGNTPRWIVLGETFPDLQRLMGFYLKHQGKYDSFLIDDPDDDSVGPALLALGVPNLQAQLQVVNDGALVPTYYSPIQRNMAGLFYEDVTDLNGGISVYDNGTIQVAGVNYTLSSLPGLAINGQSFAGLYLTWITTPTGPVTAQFNYYFRVRFDEDYQDFEKFTSGLWCIGGSEAQNSSYIKLVSARVASV